MPSTAKPPFTAQLGPYPQTLAEPDVINLGLGQPSPSLLPLGMIHAAATERLGAGGDPLVLQYGTVLGHEGFRRALAELLSRRYRFGVEASQLLVTGGISSALSWVSQRIAAPCSTVVCSDPTYFLARGIFEDQGMTIVGIEVDDDGLRVDELERRLEQGLRPSLVYCIPSFHNPRGVNLDPARAQRLVDLAERHDFMVIADEPYVMLGFGDEPPPCMMSYDDGRGRVLSLGSFSKILGPGLRLGWIHAAPAVIERCGGHGALRSGGGLNPLVADLVLGVIERGDLDRHIDHLRRTFAERSGALTRALAEHLPQAEVSPLRGGYFCWVRLPAGIDVARLLEHAPSIGVAFTPGPRCAIDRDLSRCLRLSVSFYTPEELVLGVERLAELVRRFGGTAP